ncbi:MAG: exo-alpha-sialidase [Lentisphaeria bacterium]|nr:exo-alpha-sialidase [Lentisphaeria bacterium]
MKFTKQIIFLLLTAIMPLCMAKVKKVEKSMEHILKHKIPGNPRNSEGSFVKLADGTLYFAYTCYNGTGSNDHASADIAAVTSKDNGKTWSKPFIVLKNTKMNLMSVSLLRLQNGRIAMVYSEKSAIPGWKNFVDCRSKIIFSDDETVSWSKPVEIANVPPAYFVVNNDRLIQLKSGRLILPTAHHQYDSGKMGDGIVKFFISDDSGITWRISKESIYPPSPMSRGFMEPGVVEMNDGRVMCFIRTAVGCQYKAFSYNRGENWTAAVPAPEFISPEAPMSIKRNPESGKLYAVWNDHNVLRSVRVDSLKWKRTPLVIAESSDDGVTWQNHRILEDSPTRGYCYIAMFFNGRQLHLGYCCGGLPDCSHTLQETKLCHINID